MRKGAVRGHLRRLKTGAFVYVRPHMVHRLVSYQGEAERLLRQMRSIERQEEESRDPEERARLFRLRRLFYERLRLMLIGGATGGDVLSQRFGAAIPKVSEIRQVLRPWHFLRRQV